MKTYALVAMGVLGLAVASAQATSTGGSRHDRNGRDNGRSDNRPGSRGDHDNDRGGNSHSYPSNDPLCDVSGGNQGFGGNHNGYRGNDGPRQDDCPVTIPEVPQHNGRDRGGRDHHYGDVFGDCDTPGGNTKDSGGPSKEVPGTVIPLPAAAWSGISMLGVMGIGAARRRMKRQNHA